MEQNKKGISILNYENPIEALYELYRLRKEENSCYSMAYLAKKIGIANRGNLSDMLHGRRRIPHKYWEPIMNALKIEGIQKTFLLKSLELKYSSNKNNSLIDEVAILKKAIMIHHLEKKIPCSLFAFKLYCSLGLFSKNVKTRDIYHFFSDKKESVIFEALEELERERLITIKNDKVYYNYDQVMFSGKDNPELKALLIKSFILEASVMVDLKYEDNDALFNSTIISVNKKEYLKKLNKLREDLLKSQAEMEATNADTIIAFNTQIYPC